MEERYFPDRNQWRKWLSENHQNEKEIWLVYYKKSTGRASIEYGASVEEALCYGWIDSIIRSLDGERYARKFTPRKEDSAWSESNKKRVEKLLKKGLMTEHGLKLVEAAKRNGMWDKEIHRPRLTFEMTPEFILALTSNPGAKNTFESLSTTDKKQYLAWIETARRPETRARRIAESMRLLEEGKKLGLK